MCLQDLLTSYVPMYMFQEDTVILVIRVFESTEQARNPAAALDLIRHTRVRRAGRYRGDAIYDHLIKLILGQVDVSLFSSRRFVQAAFEIAPAAVFARVVTVNTLHFARWGPSNHWSRPMGQSTRAVVHTVLLVGARLDILPNEMWSDEILRFVPPALVTDRAIALAVVGDVAAMSEHQFLHKSLREDKEVALAAVSQNGFAL